MVSRGIFQTLAAAWCALLLAALPATANPEGEEVDVALILAVDISYSMDIEEQKLQKEGYVAALQSHEVLSAIENSLTGAIAVIYVEWAVNQAVVADWTIIDGRQSAEAVGARILDSPLRRARRTSISGALNFGHKLMQRLPFRAPRKVVDVSGDGPNNSGDKVEEARNRLLDDGLIINGLPLVLKRQTGGWGDIDNLDIYYQDCVIGGPGSFVIPIRSMDQFLSATRQKIIREIAGLDDPPIIPAQARKGKTDCMIGERMVRDRWGN